MQVFAQVIEDEDGICVCDFMNALIADADSGSHAERFRRVVAATLEELECEAQARRVFRDEKILNFQAR